MKFGDSEANLSRQMLIALDGLWFMHVLDALGPDKTLEIDIKVFIGLFKIASRKVMSGSEFPSGSAQEKQAVMSSIAEVFGHRYTIEDQGDRVRLRLTECAIRKNLQRAGRDKLHDCRVLCTALSQPWFAEMEPRTGGEGHVELQLPTGGDHCDWVIGQPV